MTDVMERADADAGAEAAATAPAARPKPSRAARWRVAARLARRQVRRTWVSSLLIMALIALPIAGMAGAAVYVSSMIGTSIEKVDVELGSMQAWVQPTGVPDSDFWQVPEYPWWTGYGTSSTYEIPEGEILADPLSALPAGVETVELSEGRVQIETTAGIAAVTAWAGQVWHPGFAGRFELVEGRAPSNDREVLVTPAVLERLDTVVGGTLTLAATSASVSADGSNVTGPFTISGTFTSVGVPRSGADASAIAFADPGRFDLPRWYLPGLSLDWSDVQQLNAEGIVAYSRDVVLDPPGFVLPDGSTYNSASSVELLSMLVLAGSLAAAGVAAGYMVVMLAGAAFAVSARRQQRALAIAASVGADATDLRRTVRLQGTVLGGVAGAIGTVAGVGLAALVIRLTDNGSGTMFWGFHVPWPGLIGILVFAVVVGTLSALVPARGVARSDTISALRGARRPQKVTASRPVWGSVLIIVGVAITVACGVAAAAVTINEQIPYDSPLRWLPTVGIIVGPIIAQLGIILSGRWLLWLASRGLSRLGIAARIASRDAVANGARTVPAFAAIGATVFVGVFAVGVGTMSAGQSARAWTYNAPLGAAVANLYEPGPERFTQDVADRAAAAAAAAFETTGVTSIAVVYRQNPFYAGSADEIPAEMLRAAVLRPEKALLDPEGTWYSDYTEPGDPMNNISVIDVDSLEETMGVTLDADQRAAYEGGAALVTDPVYVTNGAVVLGAWTERQWIFGGAPSNLYQQRPGEPAYEDPQWVRTVDAIIVDAPNQPFPLAIAPTTAEELGLQTVAKMVIGTYPTTPGLDEIERLQSLTETMTTDEYAISAWIETGPTGAEAWLAPLLAGVALLVLGASAVALGLARFERRPDDATLSAVGGTAGLRRRIGFWQGLVIAGFGTFAGAVAGILPPIGFWLQSQTSWSGAMDLADIPWWLLIALAVALPLTIAIINWLVPPRHPDLTRRTAIA